MNFFTVCNSVWIKALVLSPEYETFVETIRGFVAEVVDDVVDDGKFSNTLMLTALLSPASPGIMPSTKSPGF